MSSLPSISSPSNLRHPKHLNLPRQNFTFMLLFRMSSRRHPRCAVPQDPPRALCPSNAFIFIQFRTLWRNGALPTPFPSITSALFPMQWGVGGSRISSKGFFKHCLKPLPNSELANRHDSHGLLLPLCFQSLPRCSSRNPYRFNPLHGCPGVGGWRSVMVNQESRSRPQSGIRATRCLHRRYDAEWRLPSEQARHGVRT